MTCSCSSKARAAVFSNLWQTHGCLLCDYGLIAVFLCSLGKLLLSIHILLPSEGKVYTLSVLGHRTSGVSAGLLFLPWRSRQSELQNCGPEAQHDAGHQHRWRARQLLHGREAGVRKAHFSKRPLWLRHRWTYLRTFSEIFTHAIMHFWKLKMRHFSIYVTGKTFQQESFLLGNFFISYIIWQFELQSEIRVIPGQEAPVQPPVQW